MIEFEDDADEAIQDTIYDEPVLETAEMKRVFWRIRALLEPMLVATPSMDAPLPMSLIARLAELQNAYQMVVAAQEAFNAQNPTPTADSNIDLTAIRAEIGGALDRIRDAGATKALSDEPKCCPTCSAALSV
ncbi:hypothetical protein [Yoonia sp. BS5-3]|uniref:Uncharacterized protein n=1 Tax=Yoonia phaeophyticola TaxID=3137369 RepID=A0ABZ2V179_9RHOB